MYFPDPTELMPLSVSRQNSVQGSGRATPPWSNVALPKQMESTIGQTAQCCRNQVTQVPDPHHFELTASSSKRSRKFETPYLEPLDGQTSLVYSAYLEHRVVTTLAKGNQVERLVDAEREELLASAGAGSGRRDPDAAAPRKYALTVLLSEHATIERRRGLLDSAAVLARLGEAPCVAGCVRVACLAGDDAVKYGRMHGFGTLRYESQVALVYVGSEDALHCQVAEIEYKDSNKKLFIAMRKTIAVLFEEVGLDSPPQVTASLKVSSELITDAHDRAMLEANGLFWGKLATHTPLAPLDYKLAFQEQKMYVKIAPHCYGHNLAHEHVSFGMLMYKQGMEKHAAEFVVDALTTERGNVGTNAPHDHPIGLRYPQRADELEIGLHVLHINCDLGAQFKNEISCYGVLGVPGGQVCLHKGGLVPRLVFTLRPFVAAAMRGLFVFPCTEDQVNTQNECTMYAQWKAAELGVSKYFEHLQLGPGQEVPEEPPKITLNLSKDTKPLTEEERHLARMVGLPLAGGYRVGDVHASIVRLGHDMPVLKKFLAWAMARCGPNASMAEALAKCVEIEHVHAMDLELLKADMAPQEPPPPAPSAPDPPHVLFPGRCEPVVAGRVLKAMGLVAGIGFRLEMPMTGGRITAIVTVCQRALGIPEDRSAAAWGKKNCAEMDQITAIGAVARNLHRDDRRIFAMYVREAHVVDFDEFLQVDDCVEQRPVPLQEVIKGSMDGASLFLKYDADAQKLFPLVKGGGE